MTSRSDAKNQAKLWLEAPSIMAEDLRRLIDWILSDVLMPAVEPAARKRKAFLVANTKAAEAITRIAPVDMAVYEFGRGQRKSRVAQTLLLPLMTALQQASETSDQVHVEGFNEVVATVERLEEWAAMLQRSQQRIGNRSDILGTVIEQIGDELFVKTDRDGSTRIRGATNIPMFMAFWQAHGHRLSREAFRDLDPNVSETNLERHRVRLCGKLQDVLLEIVASGNGYQLQRCKTG